MSEYLRNLSERVAVIHQTITDVTDDFGKRAAISCVTGCSQCCESPNVDVSVLDCLPLAFHIVQNGLADQVYKAAGARLICPILESHGPEMGRCGQHAHRPSLCRFFGFASMRTRRSERDLVACKKIHQQIGKRSIPDAPFMEEFSRQLMALDPSFGANLLPIREAILLAMQKVENFLNFELQNDLGSAQD